VKSKTTCETSGTSPTLEVIRQRITRAFDAIRQHPVRGPVPEPPQAPQQVVYTEQHETHFHERVKRLSLAALEGSHIATRPRRADVAYWEISAPNQSAEELIKEALGE
jgi:hypothetical protein